MKRSSMLGGVLLAAALGHSAAAQIVSEDFEGGSANGWNVYGDGSMFTWSPGEGNPSGCLQAVDLNTGIPWGFIGGPAFTGDFSAAYGGSIRYQFRTTHTGSVVPTEPDLIIESPALTVAIDLPPANLTTWLSRSVPLNELAGWRKTNLSGAVPTQAEFQGVLASVTAIRFRVEYSNSVDTGRIDNVAIYPVCVLPADLNDDGAVGLSDLSILLANFGTPSGATRATGDVNNDGAVNLSDLSILLAAFGTFCP